MQRWERRARNWLIRAQERRIRRKARSINKGDRSMANARVKPPGEGGLKVSRPVGWGIQMGRMTARWLPPRFLKPRETT
jgi:hypothetical protein